jgi:hypothetical protein
VVGSALAFTPKRNGTFTCTISSDASCTNALKYDQTGSTTVFCNDRGGGCVTKHTNMNQND